MTKPSIQIVHADSLRIGIRLAAGRYTGQRLPEDKVAEIVQSLPPQFSAKEFPLDVLTSHYRERCRGRKEVAQRTLEAMLHHAGDPAYLTEETLKSLVGKAWMLAREMEDQEMGQSVIDQLENKQIPGV